MSVVVTNVGMFERNANGERTTNQRGSFGDQGTVRVEYQGIQYVFGPGESKSFSDEGIAAALVAGDGRLRIADTREGFNPTGRS